MSFDKSKDLVISDISKDWVILEFNAVAGKAPAIEDVKRQFKLSNDEIYDSFGVRPRENGYKSFLAIISTEACERVKKEHRSDFVGNWPVRFAK